MSTASQRWQLGLPARAASLVRKRSLIIITGICLSLIIFFGPHINDGTPRVIFPGAGHVSGNQVSPATTIVQLGKGDRKFNGTWDRERDSRNLMLTDEQCSVAFPGLFDEIERMAARRKNNRITLKEMDDNEDREYHKVGGHTKGYIYDHNVCRPRMARLRPPSTKALTTPFQIYVTNLKRGYFTRGIGLLQAMHRAMLTSPEPIPNIQFAFFSVDIVRNVTGWALTRRSDDLETWLMPDFGYFSWPEPKISSYNHVQRRAREMEEGSPHGGPNQKTWPWKDKIPRLIWRGSKGTEEMPRRALVRAAAGEPWGDARPVNWDPKGDQAHVLTMADHCKYKYVAHTEGVSYSGRLKYLQNCRSVVVAHALKWRTHAMHLMRASGPEQNFVEVRPDYADLEEKMEWLLADEARAERIADNSARVFRDRYLTPAAETCYWRRLFRAWASVSEEARPWVEGANSTGEYKGVAVEDYFMMHTLEWDRH